VLKTFELLKTLFVAAVRVNRGFGGAYYMKKMTATLCKFEPQILIKDFRKTLQGFQCRILFPGFSSVGMPDRNAENFGNISWVVFWFL